MSTRAEKRLEAAEHVCKAFRKACSYYATQEAYMLMAVDWLIVWMKYAPKKVRDAAPTPRVNKRSAV